MFEFNTHVREHEWTRTCFENIEHEPIRTLIFRKVSNTYKHDRVSPRKYRTLQTWTNTNAYLKTLTLIPDHDSSLFPLPESLALTAMLTSWSLILSEQLTFGGLHRSIYIILDSPFSVYWTIHFLFLWPFTFRSCGPPTFWRFGPSTYTSTRFRHEYQCSPFNVIG